MIDRYIEMDDDIWECTQEESIDPELQARLLAENNCDCYKWAKSLADCPLCSGTAIYELCKKTGEFKCIRLY